MGHTGRIQRAAESGKQQPGANTCSSRAYIEQLPYAADTDCTITVASCCTISLPAGESQVRGFIKACEEASLAQAEQTVAASAVTLAANKFSTSYEPCSLSTIRAVMWPEAETLIAQLHKLHIYRPGDYRKASVCSPPDNDVVGYLIVCLPQRHCGGTLEVSHQDEGEETCDLAHSGIGRTAWVAFKPGCQQEITPVLDGYCLTLTYHLYCKGDAGIPRGLSAETTPLFNSLAAGILSSSFLPLGGAVAFPTHYPYPHTRKNEDKVLRLLRGKDREYKQVLKRLGLKPRVGAVLDFSRLQQRLGCDWEDDRHGQIQRFQGGEYGESHEHLRVTKLGCHYSVLGERLHEGWSTFRDVEAYQSAFPAQGIVWLSHHFQHFTPQVKCKVYDKDGKYLPEEVCSMAAVYAVVPAWGSETRQRLVQHLGAATAAVTVVAICSEEQCVATNATSVGDADKVISAPTLWQQWWQFWRGTRLAPVGSDLQHDMISCLSMI